MSASENALRARIVYSSDSSSRSRTFAGRPRAALQERSASTFSAKSVWFGSMVMDANQLLIILFAILSMLSVTVLATRDVIERLGERLVDRYRPLRARREKLTLTQHMVLTERAELGLDTIQSVSIERQRFTTTLIAQTAQGDVPIALHRSQQVMEMLGEVIEQQATRYRQGLRERGQDPDHPAHVPQNLQQLRLSSP